MTHGKMVNGLMHKYKRSDFGSPVSYNNPSVGSYSVNPGNRELEIDRFLGLICQPV